MVPLPSFLPPFLLSSFPPFLPSLLPSLLPSIYLSICLSVYLSIYLSTYLSISLSQSELCAPTPKSYVEDLTSSVPVFWDSFFKEVVKVKWDNKGEALIPLDECLVFFLIHFIYLFIYFWLWWVFVAARGLSLVAASGGYSSWRYTGFSLRWLLLLQSTGSRCAGFSRCGSLASVVWLAGSRAQAQ